MQPRMIIQHLVDVNDYSKTACGQSYISTHARIGDHIKICEVCRIRVLTIKEKLDGTSIRS